MISNDYLLSIYFYLVKKDTFVTKKSDIIHPDALTTISSHRKAVIWLLEHRLVSISNTFTDLQERRLNQVLKRQER